MAETRNEVYCRHHVMRIATCWSREADRAGDPDVCADCLAEPPAPVDPRFPACSMCCAPWGQRCDHRDDF
jgi:hypothetical protein